MGVAYAVLTAAGAGTRLKSNGPKALVRLGGVTLLERAARGLAEAGIAGTVVTVSADHVSEFAALFPDNHVGGMRIRIVPGSPASRQASVALGLAAVADLANECGEALSGETTVLVHDAARALTPPNMIRRVIDAVKAGAQVVIPGLAVTDTIKEVTTDHSSVDVAEGDQTSLHDVSDAPHGGATKTEKLPVVVGTPNRSALISVQTPQGFTWDALSRAHAAGSERAGSEATAATDDAGLAEAIGIPVNVVAGDPLALKITTSVDLSVAELLL